MPRRLLACFAALCVFAVHAQDPQKPASEAQKPEVEAEKPAAEAAQPEAAPAPERAPGQEPDPAILEGIFACIAEGLPQGWKKTWFVITEVGRNATGTSRDFEAKFFFATTMSDRKGRPLVPCGAERVLDGVGALNDYLREDQRRWTMATFSFNSDGKFDVKYDFTPRKPKPAPKPAAKKPEPGKV